MTYLTALCDDETVELNKTEKILGAYEQERSGVEFVIERFESAGDLLCRIEDKNYAPDLIFMDIFMPGEEGEQESCGMKTAKKLRSMGNRAKLFFLTTSREYALEAFDVEASQYLLKPVTQEKMFNVLDRLLKEGEKERKRYILLKFERRIARVAVDDIVCCEAQGKTQCLHLSDGGEYALLLPYHKFVRIGAAFIVNLECVGSLNAHEICLMGGRKIYLPRGTYKGLREQYFNYYCQIP